MAKLKDIKISHISIVNKAANKRAFILKFEDKEFAEVVNTQISKIDSDKQMIYGIVYAPEDVDAHGDYTTKEEIEKASQEFMKSLNNLNIDKGHSFKNEQAFVAESWLIRKGDALFPKEKEGAWAVGIKVESQDLWNEIKSGAYTGLSMAGLATLEKQESKLDKAIQIIKDLFKKENEMTKEEVMAIAKEVTLKKEDLAVIFKSAFADAVKPMLERLEKIEKQSEGSKQSPEPINKQDDLISLGLEIAKLANGGK